MDSDRQNAGRPINKTQGRLDKLNNSLEDGDLEETGIKTRVLQRERRGGVSIQQLPGHSTTPGHI